MIEYFDDYMPMMNFATFIVPVGVENAEDLIEMVEKERRRHSGSLQLMIGNGESTDEDLVQYSPTRVEELFEDGILEPGVYGLAYGNGGRFSNSEKLTKIIEPRHFRLMLELTMEQTQELLNYMDSSLSF